jgi:hypothetical protein
VGVRTVPGTGTLREIQICDRLTSNLRFQRIDPISQILDATLGVYIEPIENLHCVVIGVLRSK